MLVFIVCAHTNVFPLKKQSQEGNILIHNFSWQISKQLQYAE